MEEYLGYRADQDMKSKEEKAKALPLPWPLGPRVEENGDTAGELKKKVGRPKKVKSP